MTTVSSLAVGDWALHRASLQPCRIVDRQELWGATSFLVFAPASGQTFRAAAQDLSAIDDDPSTAIHRVTYAAAAARIAATLAGDTLVAPVEGTLIPLPHQIAVLARAMAGDRIRFLLADEVGLGKTIEAGLVLRELKIRGLVRRTLVVAPAGLVTQWVQEMRVHFSEDFRLVVPGNFGAVRQLAGMDDAENVWRLHEQVVCSMDAVKPLDARRGWSRDEIAQYNRERFDDLLSAGWDLIIVDEAHRLGGSTEQVARYRLGEALSQASPYLLLLSATPHQGKTDAFRRIMALLDAERFPDDTAVRKDAVAPYVIRTEKRHAVDAEGQALFKPRRTQLLPVGWASPEQQALYEAVTSYVRDGYNRALAARQTAVGFLMLLMQRLVTSSTRAIRTALERRLDVLELPSGQLSLFGEDIGERWLQLDGQEQMEMLLQARLKGLKSERAEVELLLSAARRCEAAAPDVKAQALLGLIHRLQGEEEDPDVKVLVFTEFIPTQEMLATFLRERGFRVACLNGSLGLDDRRRVQEEFAAAAQCLISTDAGGEGLNLQFAHVVVNYDLPWNPMKLEQRIGRVDRIGQQKVVRAFNLALEDTVELRVREVLEEKLQRILEEFGVDKLSDVLDSEAEELDFEDLFARSILAPDAVPDQVGEFARGLREKAEAAREGRKLLGESRPVDVGAARSITESRIPYWTERMTTAYLRSLAAIGAQAEPETVGYRLRWPDGHTVARAVFSHLDIATTGVEHLSLEDARVRQLVRQLPHWPIERVMAGVEIPGISDKVSGVWSLWRIVLHVGTDMAERVFPLFVSDDGRSLGPTARAIWDRVIESDAPDRHKGHEGMREPVPDDVAAILQREAERHGEALHRELLEHHELRAARSRAKTIAAFEARARAIERIGLPQVRRHRAQQLHAEREAWEASEAHRPTAVPELHPIVVVRVLSSSGGETAT